MFQTLKEVRRIGKDLGVEVKIEVMDTREYLRRYREDEQWDKDERDQS
jgi:hypothetical protein